MRNLDGLTAVRFYAALWVFLFHFNIRLPLPWGKHALRVIENGALAMPVFFMLSGLVLAYRYRDTYAGFSLFFRARVARIYPAYILGVVLCLPFLASLPGFDAATGFFLVPVDLLLLQSWFPNLWHFWHHAGTWSISVEFFLYASFPLLLGMSALSTRALLTICAACVVLASSWVPSLGVGASNDVPFPIFYSMPLYSLPTFGIGVVMAELHRRGFRGSGWAPLVLLLVLAWIGYRNDRYAALNAVVLPLVALTLLFAANYVRGTGVARLFINRATIYLGDISYAFFVYQIPLLLALEHWIEPARAVALWLLLGGLLGANLLLAALSHHWLEPWGRRLIVRRWPQPTSRAYLDSLESATRAGKDAARRVVTAPDSAPQPARGHLPR